MSKFEKNLSEGSVFKNLIVFAFPFFISSIIQSLYNIADMLIVGQFCGPASMTGVNIGGQVTFILTNIVVGFCVGASVLIGHYIGSGDKDSMKKATSTLLTLLAIIAFVITIVMLIFKDRVLHLIRTPQEAYAESSVYLTVTVIGIIFIFGYNALSAILRGMGDSKHPFYFVLIACVTNIVLDLIFVAVFKWAAFGAALATVISQTLSMFLCIWFMIKNKFLFDFKLSSFKIDKEQFKRIFNIGLPTCVQNGVTSMSFLFITGVVNSFNNVIVSAAVGAAGKMFSFVILPMIAIGTSVATVSAQNFGAGKISRAAKACRSGIFISMILSYVLFIVLLIIPSPLMRMFSSDAEVIRNGVTYIRSSSFDFLIVPFVFCLNNLYIGGGHTKFTLFSSLISSILLRVPVSYILGKFTSLGLIGVGLGAPAASFGGLVILLIFLLTGKWKKPILHEFNIVEQ